jgi:hypothetical protein
VRTARTCSCTRSGKDEPTPEDWQPYDGPVLDRVELRGEGWQTNYHEFRERWIGKWRKGTVVVLAASNGTHMIAVHARSARARGFRDNGDSVTPDA